MPIGLKHYFLAMGKFSALGSLCLLRNQLFSSRWPTLLGGLSLKQILLSLHGSCALHLQMRLIPVTRPKFHWQICKAQHTVSAVVRFSWRYRSYSQSYCPHILCNVLCRSCESQTRVRGNWRPLPSSLRALLSAFLCFVD